jgi:hypothetical protein
MRRKRPSRKMAAGASVALATAGLSTCHNNGAVDPPPPPLQCNTVDEGETLTATATATARELTVTIRNSSSSTWTDVEVTSVVGGSARPVAPGQTLTIVIDLTDETVTRGAFTLRGTLAGFGGVCTVSRTFQFTLGPGGVMVAATDELPLSARQQARIVLRGRDGREVELEATTPFRREQSVTWTVTAGEVLSQDGARLRWRLPVEPGLYQAELVIDYGALGLSFDALALEVS